MASGPLTGGCPVKDLYERASAVDQSLKDRPPVPVICLRPRVDCE